MGQAYLGSTAVGDIIGMLVAKVGGCPLLRLGSEWSGLFLVASNLLGV